MHAAKEAIWIWTFVNEIRGVNDDPITINCDNQGAIVLAKDNKYHSHTKHIDLLYHFIRKAVEDWKILVNYIPTEQNLSDVLTKALARPKFKRFVEMLGLRKLKDEKEKEARV